MSGFSIAPKELSSPTCSCDYVQGVTLVMVDEVLAIVQYAGLAALSYSAALFSCCFDCAKTFSDDKWKTALSCQEQANTDFGRILELMNALTCSVFSQGQTEPGSNADTARKPDSAQPHQDPVIISAEPGERWMWCYKDELMVDY